LAGDEADETLMSAEHRMVDGFPLQTLGGVKFECVVDAQHVDRAHLGHHVGRDQHHDLVQSLLRADLLRHGFAEPSQQDAGTSRRAPYVLSVLHASGPAEWPGSWGQTPENNKIAQPAPTQPSAELGITQAGAQLAAAHSTRRIAN